MATMSARNARNMKNNKKGLAPKQREELGKNAFCYQKTWRLSRITMVRNLIMPTGRSVAR